MPYANQSGHARTNPRAPQAFAVCDDCGAWYNRVNLYVQREWYGDNLADTGYRVCRRCLSKPQPQLKPVILPQDPIPIIDSRPERYQAQQSINGPTRPIVWQNQNGFTQIVGPQGIRIQMPVLAEFDPTNPIEGKNQLWISLFNAGYPVPVLTDDFGNILTDDFGNVLLQDGVTEGSGTIGFPGVGQKIFAGYPLPILISDDGLSVLTADDGTVLLQDGADPTGVPLYVPTVADAYARNNIMIYNPTGLMLCAAQNAAPTIGISAASLIGSLRTGNPTASNAEAGTVYVGTGEALMQNILETTDAVLWQGSVWVLGLVPGAPYWAWEW
jgi:hypothetical protein